MRFTEILLKVLAGTLALAALGVTLGGCGGKPSGKGEASGSGGQAGSSVNGSGSASHTESGDQSPVGSGDLSPEGAQGEGKTLVAFFSRAGENYNVGVIKTGNTRVVADLIAERTGADLFEIRTVTPYPESYDECTDVAMREQTANARPEIVDPPASLDAYDTVFVGYPIWWGDLPMAVYSFLERYDFSGKTVIPFCTHEGSGLGGTQSGVEKACPGAKVRAGLAVKGTVAQNDHGKAKSAVEDWLGKLGF